MAQEVKYLIIGAGVSGLSFVNFLKDTDYLILEKESVPGGYCKTTQRNGYTWDYSGHFFHFKDPEIKRFFMEQLDESELVFNKKNTKIYINGSYVDFPFQKNIHQLPQSQFLECLYELYFRQKNPSVNSFKEMLYANFGSGISEMFLIPYNEKLYACDLNTLDADAMGRFFPYASTDEIIANFKQSQNTSYNDTFMYHRRGAFAFIEALLSKVDKTKIKYNQSVIRIDKKNKRVTTASGNTYRYQYLINTADFAHLVEAVEEQKLDCLSYNQVHVYNLGFDKAPVDPTIHWIYYPEKKYIFYRVGFYNNILHQDKMSLYVEIGHPSQFDGQDELNTILADLKKVGIITTHKLIDHEHIVMSPAYVHINKRSMKAVSEKLSQYGQDNIFSIGRYGRWEYSSIEDAVLAAKELAGKLC